MEPMKPMKPMERMERIAASRWWPEVRRTAADHRTDGAMPIFRRGTFWRWSAVAT